MILKDLPHWFFQWFILIGPKKDMLHQDLLEMFNLYYIDHPRHQKIDNNNKIKNLILLRFMGKYDIPWIWQWSFNNASHDGLSMLVRDYFYKWWPRFEYNEIMVQIKSDIETFIEFNKQVELDKEEKNYNEECMEDTECIHDSNEDMEAHMGKWLTKLYKGKKDKKDKGKIED